MRPPTPDAATASDRGGVESFDLTVFAHRVRVVHREGRSGEDGSPVSRVPLVLLNGIGARLELLAPFVDHLDERIPVIRFDVPGVGESPAPLTPYRFSGMAALVRRLVKRLGYDRADVLGISWGGGLAQQLAWQSPRFCRRVVLCATATGALMFPAGPQVLSKMITPQRYRDPEYARQVAAELYGGSMRQEPEVAGSLLAARPGLGSSWGYACQLLAGWGWTSLPLLPFIRQRTLILAGDDDPIIPLANGRVMSTLIPRSRLHIYNDGHLGLVTSADELGPVVSAFLLRP